MNRTSWKFVLSGVCLLAIVLLLRLLASEIMRQQPDAAPMDIASWEAAPEKLGPASPEKVPPPEVDPGTSLASAQDYAEQRATFLEKVELLFGSRERRRGVLYQTVVATLDRESVPFLRELLEDVSYKDQWSQLGIMIAWLSDGNDAESVAAILAYIRRRHTWSNDDRDSILDDTVRKGATLYHLGLFNSELVSETLRNAFTEKGAEDLIRPWVTTQNAVEPLYLAFIIRSWATKGLVLTRDPENVALVKESYEALTHKMLTVEYREKELTDEMWLDSERHLAFVGGMTNNDMLADMGVEEFLRLRDNSEKWARTTFRFSARYEGTYMEDERTVMDWCPVCGITSGQKRDSEADVKRVVTN